AATAHPVTSADFAAAPAHAAFPDTPAAAPDAGLSPAGVALRALLPLEPLALGDHLFVGEHGFRHREYVLPLPLVVHRLLRGEPGGGENRHDEQDVDRDQDAAEDGSVALSGGVDLHQERQEVGQEDRHAT
ncbi:unnamed protein product, partial [Ectocarpus fasciculatus]